MLLTLGLYIDVYNVRVYIYDSGRYKRNISMEQTCFICRNNFDLKYGRPCISKVPLFKATKNKEFASKLCGEQSTIFSDILKSLDLLDNKLVSMIDKCCTSVCKKCARKIVNCGSLFQELRSSITLNCPKHKNAYKCQTGNAIRLWKEKDH